MGTFRRITDRESHLRQFGDTRSLAVVLVGFSGVFGGNPPALPDIATQFAVSDAQVGW